MAAPLRRCTFCQKFHFKSLRLFPNSYRKVSTKCVVKNEWIGVVGLEIHAQINSSSKLFSGASTQYGGSTNSQVSFFDAALPGTLPVLNQRCVEAGVFTAMALKCKINRVSMFDRKHYFFADLPAGYQITQFRKPIAVDGEMIYVYQCSKTSRVERRLAQLVQIQLEQDSGKSLHDTNEGVSLIDLNRAGVGLMEIVTKPGFSGGDDAASFVRELRDVLVTINTCDGKMAEGSLRVDANVSIHKSGQPLGVRTEVKNLNSLKSIRQAIDYEIERQIDFVEDGGVIVNETRSFDVEAGETVPMRDKEKILDYRFMPEPNLPPLVLHTQSSSSLAASPSSTHVILEDVENKMKELPDMTRLHLEETYNLPLLQSMQLVREKLYDLLERLVKKYGCSPTASSFVLLHHYKPNMEKVGDADSCITEDTLAQIIHLYASGEISGSSVGILMNEAAINGVIDVHSVTESKGLIKVGEDSITDAIGEVLAKNPKIVKAYKKGKTNQLKVLTGKVLKQLEGRASTETVKELMIDRLKD